MQATTGNRTGNDKKETHPNITEFLQRLQLVARLEPCEALFGGTYQCSSPLCQDRDSVRGLHLPLSVGEQKLPLPDCSSCDHHPTIVQRHFKVLWLGQVHHHPTTRPVPSCLTVPMQGQIDIPYVPDLCRKAT